MTLVLVLLALALMFVGTASVVFGAPIIDVERGLGMVVAGTTGASAGAVLLGVAVAAHRLRRIEHAITGIGDLASGDPEKPVPPVERAVAGEIQLPRRSRQPIHREPPVDPEPASDPAEQLESAAAGTSIVGRYASGGNSYVMYSDGSIEADTPAGKRRFTSMDELKDFAAANRSSSR